MTRGFAIIALSVLLAPAFAEAAPRKKRRRQRGTSQVEVVNGKSPETPPARPVKSPAPTSLTARNRTVPLDPDAERHSENVTGAPLQLTALTFPEGLDSVVCGNCTDKQGQQPENWYLLSDKEKGTVYLKPTRYPGPAHPETAFQTTVYVTLASGYRITLNVRLARILQDESPDGEVLFTLPKQATLSGKLREERKRQEAEFAERLETASTQLFLQSLMGELVCESASGRPYQDNRLYVRPVQYCTAAANPPSYWVVFEVQNRNNELIELDSALLADVAELDPMLDDATRAFRLERSALRFDERTLGIALTTLAPNQPPPAGWTLIVNEKGGSGRVVTVENIEF